MPAFPADRCAHCDTFAPYDDQGDVIATNCSKWRSGSIGCPHDAEVSMKHQDVIRPVDIYDLSHIKQQPSNDLPAIGG